MYRQQRPRNPGRNYCLEGHMILGFILSLASAILLYVTLIPIFISLTIRLLVSLSTPFIKSITFLNTSTGYHYGAFGYCTTPPDGITDVGLGGEEGCVRATGYTTGEEMTLWITRTAVLFPLAAALMFATWITVILGMCSVGMFSWNPKVYRTFAILGTLSSLAAEIFALVQWVTARNRFQSNDVPNSYGAALWMGLAAAISAFLAMCIGGPAFGGNRMYSADRQVAYNV